MMKNSASASNDTHAHPADELADVHATQTNRTTRNGLPTQPVRESAPVVSPAVDSTQPVRETTPPTSTGQPVRAINEDDDGYDPYSDLHDQGSSAPLFERDPWD